MNLLGLELSDAGILVAGGRPPQLLQVDGHNNQSPGFALPEKKRLTVGAAAERQAHLYPRQILNHFWDQLNTEPLEQPNPFARNHAELCFEHLAYIWQTVQPQGKEVVIAAPGYYNREHLGLILGITRELAMPVKGLVTLAVAAVPNRLPAGLLLHLDIHLHRFEITHLQRTARIEQKDSVSAEGSGLSKLYRGWVEVIAKEFVRSTRFDPLHQAATEQELYDRLPGVLSQLNQHPSVLFEMTGGSKVYHVTLTRDLFYQKSLAVFEEIRRLIGRLSARYRKDEPRLILQLTHRIAGLPGFKDMLAQIENVEIIDLPPGAGALGALRLRDQLFEQQADSGIPFLTARPLPADAPIVHEKTAAPPETQPRPTHILYRDLAYRLSDKPIIIGLDRTADGSGIQIRGQIAGVSRKHCSIQLRGKDVILNDYSTYGTFVNDAPVSGSAVLSLGQVIRVGSPGEELRLIACVNTDEA